MERLQKESELVAHLAAHPLFHSHDLDETRDTVGRIFKPHDLGVKGKRQHLDARMDHLPIGKASINRLRYGANVNIEPESLDDFLLVQMPLSGKAEIRCGQHEIISTPEHASVLTPSLPLHMNWQGVCDQLIVRLERATLESVCSAYLGHALPKPLEFQLGMNLNSSDGMAWYKLVHFLVTSQFIEGAANQPLIAAQVEQMLATTLLTRHPHNYAALLQQPATTPNLPYVRKAEEYIHAHCHEPITVQDLARHANISTRSLHNGFQHYRGISPMAYVRLVRLQRVRDELLQARNTGQPTSITRIALNWGFGHLGHFTQAYRKQFNELPSETLRG